MFGSIFLCEKDAAVRQGDAAWTLSLFQLQVCSAPLFSLGEENTLFYPWLKKHDTAAGVKNSVNRNDL